VRNLNRAAFSIDLRTGTDAAVRMTL